jgi:hypothetical protein
LLVVLFFWLKKTAEDKAKAKAKTKANAKAKTKSNSSVDPSSVRSSSESWKLPVQVHKLELEPPWDLALSLEPTSPKTQRPIRLRN